MELEEKRLNSKLIYKLLLVSIKYIPIIQMVGMLLNNTLYKFDICNLSYILDFTFGNSLIVTFLITICSFIFKFCIWHRLIILANFINITIAAIDSVHKINIRDGELLVLYYIIYGITLLIITYIHIKKMSIERKIKMFKELLELTSKNIDAGNSNCEEEELDDIIDMLSTLNRGTKRISKRYACEHILHCSSSTFDNYLKLGLIPPGHKEIGFKELSWSKKDFDEATLYRIKKYSEKKGL